ncbi:MAG: hypothetical protein HYX31_26950 [Mycobacterium sp.]|nr:hypothetical protein [Mycobacterium sp.]
MCPSTDAGNAAGEFATEVLRNLLHRIDNENQEGSGPYIISHAWTEGPIMFLVYSTPPSEITWGLARDTSESLIDPSPWPNIDEAVRYYYRLDLEEGAPSFVPPGEPDAILWGGDPQDDLPERLTDIPEEHRYMSRTSPSTATRGREQGQHIVNEARRYVDPREL